MTFRPRMLYSAKALGAFVAKRQGVSLAKIVGSGIAGIARLFTLPFGGYYGKRIAAQAAMSLTPTLRVNTPRGVLKYPAPSPAAVKHASHLVTREPDTIAWLDEFVRSGDYLWDVGANIGAYALYAALRDGVTVTAFEPMPGNHGVLTDALIANGLGDRVTALPMGLSDHTGLVTIHLIDTEAGTGLHALGEPVNVRGRFEAAASITVPVIRGDEAVARFGIARPTHIKIDVDGHEMKVLQGLSGVLDGVKSVWIETTPDADKSGANAEIDSFLAAHGFKRGTLAQPVKGENTLFVKA